MSRMIMVVLLCRVQFSQTVLETATGKDGLPCDRLVKQGYSPIFVPGITY